MIWFTSDTHFGHKNIIEYCERPFTDVNTMNNALLRNWNDRVQVEDEVYFLGDFAFLPRPEAQNILSMLHGTKYLIIGNHDKVARKLDGWVWVKPQVGIKLDGYAIEMSHYPDDNWSPYHKRVLRLHGHSHGSRPYTKQQIDIGVDCCNYKPVTLKEIISAIPR